MSEEFVYSYTFPIDPGVEIEMPKASKDQIKTAIISSSNGDVLIAEYPDGFKMTSKRTKDTVIVRCNRPLFHRPDGGWAVEPIP